MKKLVLVLLVALPLFAHKQRAVDRKQTFDLPIGANDVLPEISGPLTGWVSTDLKTRGGGRITLRVSTFAESPWGDASWVSRHRVSGGALVVNIIRAHSVGNGSAYCVVGTISVPAAPNQNVDYDLDMSTFAIGDAIMFEDWPGYKITAQVPIGPGGEFSVGGDVRRFPEEFPGEARGSLPVHCQ